MKAPASIALLVSLLPAVTLPAARPREVRLWPDAAPGETKVLPSEADLTQPTDNLQGGRTVVRLGNVSTPTMTIYSPGDAHDTGAAVVVCPGGGYNILAMDLEGTEVCAWLNSIGVTGVLLKYRVPRREGIPQHVPPLQDAQRALGLLRHQAKEHGIDPRRIGVLGFSAGAHVAAVLSNNHETRAYPVVDAADQTSCRPDFAVLIYPGHLAGKETLVAPEVAVSAPKTPPTFLAMAQDDPVRVENAINYYLALKQAGVPAEMHLYPVGGHGYGLRRTEATVTTWPDRVADWMKASGWLESSPGTRRVALDRADVTNVSPQDRPPRKVLIGTVITGYDFLSWTLPERLERMDELVGRIAARARNDHAEQRLDLVVLPEFFLSRPGDTLAQQAVRLDEVQPRIAACATRHGCYLVTPLLLQETDPVSHHSNVALLVDRSGEIVGIYRKVHPVAPQGSDVLESGTTPGREFPVFDCDFGRLGIQICFDMLYADGWQALAKQGAEIVALPSASPETVRPSMYALQHKYYIVSATPRDHAAVFSPLGLIEAQVPQGNEVLVHQIDLSYAILHWEAPLEEGAALRRMFGSKVGFHYYRSEDKGIFWSNDPDMTIGQMIGSLGLTDSDANVERVRRLQDEARGGPPLMP